MSRFRVLFLSDGKDYKKRKRKEDAEDTYEKEREGSTNIQKQKRDPKSDIEHMKLISVYFPKLVKDYEKVFAVK